MERETIGKRLRSARLMRGLTMDELIGQMQHKVSKNAISRYENGVMVPRLTVLEDLARVLQQPLDYFMRPVSVVVKYVKFRTKSALPAKAIDSIQAQAIELMERYLETERLLMHNSSFVNPMAGTVIHNAQEAETAANNWRQSWQLGEKGLHNIYGLLEKHHIKVAELENTDEAFDGLAITINDDAPIIMLNKQMTIERRRFTALHELAHLLFTFDEQHMSNDEQEKACHRFAGAALMPCSLLQSLLGSKRESVLLDELINIKELYGISLQALMYRCVECDIISYRRHLTFKNWIADNLKEEGLGSYQGKEETNRFELMVLKALDQEQVSLSKAADLLRMEVRQLKQKLERRF